MLSASESPTENTSGGGSSAVVPAELVRWNWGAFLLTWVWGIGNRTFLALLAFVPLANLVIPFVLGAHGSTWAWQNRQWQSVEHFKSVQRQWALWGIATLVVGIAVAVTGFFLMFGFLKSSEPYQLAATRVENDPRATELLGTPISSGVPHGNMSVSGPSGRAEFSFAVEGPKGEGTVFMMAVKELGQWRLEALLLEDDVTGHRIELLREETPASSAVETQDPSGGGDVRDAPREPTQEEVEAFQAVKTKAVQGDVEAQAELGSAYAEARGTERDFRQAAEWFAKAAEQRHAEAQLALGQLYYGGKGVPQNFSQAASWFRKAAEQGHAVAQDNLGFMYRDGQGVPQDYGQAVNWWRKAAEQGDASAQKNLGLAYHHGEGVPQDFEHALKWFHEAADQGDASAQYQLGNAYYYAQGVEQNFEQAVQWYGKAAEQGDVDAQNKLGMMYYRGRGIPQDFTRAANWFRKAAEQGSEEAVEALEALGAPVPRASN